MRPVITTSDGINVGFARFVIAKPTPRRNGIPTAARMIFLSHEAEFDTVDSSLPRRGLLVVRYSTAPAVTIPAETVN